MPCGDGGVPYPSVPDKEKQRLKARLDLATRLLCTTLHRIEHIGREWEGKPVNINFFISDDEELTEWWINHQKEDKVREAKKHKAELAKIAKKQKEEKRLELLARLTAEEKELLGL